MSTKKPTMQDLIDLRDAATRIIDAAPQRAKKGKKNGKPRGAAARRADDGDDDARGDDGDGDSGPGFLDWLED